LLGYFGLFYAGRAGSGRYPGLREMEIRLLLMLFAHLLAAVGLLLGIMAVINLIQTGKKGAKARDGAFALFGVVVCAGYGWLWLASLIFIGGIDFRDLLPIIPLGLIVLIAIWLRRIFIRRGRHWELALVGLVLLGLSGYSIDACLLITSYLATGL
jgi:hypothetical protein